MPNHGNPRRSSKASVKGSTPMRARMRGKRESRFEGVCPRNAVINHFPSRGPSQNETVRASPYRKGRRVASRFRQASGHRATLGAGPPRPVRVPRWAILVARYRVGQEPERPGVSSSVPLQGREPWSRECRRGGLTAIQSQLEAMIRTRGSKVVSTGLEGDVARLLRFAQRSSEVHKQDGNDQTCSKWSRRPIR